LSQLQLIIDLFGLFGPLALAQAYAGATAILVDELDVSSFLTTFAFLASEGARPRLPRFLRRIQRESPGGYRTSVSVIAPGVIARRLIFIGFVRIV
jgi:hypothetical protein